MHVQWSIFKCLVPPDKLGSFPRSSLHDHDKTRDIYLLLTDGAHSFHFMHVMRQARKKHPFWESLPLSNIFSIGYLLQGVFKHLVAWLLNTFRPAEIDAWCLATNHHISVFAKGISPVSQVRSTKIWVLFSLVLLYLSVPNGQVLLWIIAVEHTLIDFFCSFWSGEH